MSADAELPARDDTIRDTKRIGDIIVELGYATAEQIDSVLQSDADATLQLGTKLLRAGIIDDVKLARALSVHLGVGFTNLSRSTDVDPLAVSRVPEHIARRHSILPIRLNGRTLTVAMASPGNVFAIDAARETTGLRIEVEAAPEQALRRAMDRCYAFDLESTASALAADSSDDAQEPLGFGLDITQMRTEAADAPVIKYVDSLISHAIRDRASDIHIEPNRDSVSVRIRVDGKLRPTIAPPKSVQNAVVSRIKILSNLDIAEKRLPLDGRLHVRFQDRMVDLRVSTLPAIHGEKVVMRILDKESIRMELDTLGFDEQFLDHLKATLSQPNGIMLVTGPTGSGKTTTLYACLNYVRDITKNVISVEDPVEYEIDGVTQVAARPDIGMGFARALRSILRQDPDVIMVGEMRDLDTLEIGIRAALTGHLVLSTLHTNDASSTVTRMVNMGAEPYLIASTLLTAIAQRLVRCICPECKDEFPLDEAIRENLESRYAVQLPPVLWRGRGCSLCSNTGYYGRSAVFEYFHIDEKAKQMIANQASESEMRLHQRRFSLGSLLDNALQKAIAGVTTLEEAMQFEVTG